jgi:hypothetical protein
MHDIAVARHNDVRRRELLDDPAFRDMPQRQTRLISNRRAELQQALPPIGDQQRQPGMHAGMVAALKNAALSI